MYLCAGCIYLPHIEEEAVKGRHMVGRRVYNQSYLFNPNGVCLRRTPKINLAPPTEPRFGFSPGNRSDLMPVDTKIGRLGTLVCYDAFHRSLIERMDAMGVETLINPRTTSGAGTSRRASTRRSPSARRGCTTGCRR